MENAVERAVILAETGEKIEADQLGISNNKLNVKAENTSEVDFSVDESMLDVERKHIKRILEYCNGNRTHASKKLGLNVRTLRNKIKEFKLEE